MARASHGNCTTCLRGKASPFTVLSESELRRINQQKNMHMFGRGEVVFHEGTPALAAYCVQSGRLELYAEHKKGRLQSGRLVGPNRLIGLTEVLVGRPYVFSAKVIEAASLCIISESIIHKLLVESHAFTQAVLRAIADDFLATLERLTGGTRNPVKQRLARVLLEAAQPQSGDPPSKKRTQISMLRSELAELAGTTPETCSRMLSVLQGASVVELTRTAVVIRNLQALKRLAGVEGSPTNRASG